MRKLNITGQRFGKLVALKPYDCETKRSKWLCKCDCGSTAAVNLYELKSGKTKSCGCLRREFARRPKKHGHAKRGAHTKTYSIWRSLFKRCYNPLSPSYHRYGGRGIEVDPRWFQYSNFYKDMGDCPEGMSIERVNNNRNYWKGNCVWATPKQQMQNTSINFIITWQGQRKTIAQWAERVGLKESTIHMRLKRLGWSVDKALSTPVRPIKSGRNKNT